MNHPVLLGDLRLRVGDDGEVHGDLLGLLDVLHPALVAVERVDAQREGLAAALGEVVLQGGHEAQLRGADRRVVRRMGEEEDPIVSGPLVEADLPFGGLGFEIGGGASQLQ